MFCGCFFFFQAEDGIRDLVRSRGLGDVYKRQHHIFPQAWCKDNSIEERVYNAIVNKTPISYKANRMIGGKAPSEYLSKLQNHQSVQLSELAMNDILNTHLINTDKLRNDNFIEFYQDRKEKLCQMIEDVMGKSQINGESIPNEYELEEPDDETNDFTD